jgi:GT2 family glycosyltransferase
MKNSLSIIIPNFNGKHLLEKNLPSVMAAAKQCGWAFEIIVADDSSTDDSVLFLKKNYAEIILVENKINGGFSKNINSGIKIANHDWVFALNSDISLDEKYFEPLAKYLADENCFGVMGSIYDEQTKQLIDAAKYPATKGLQVVGTINYKLQIKDNSLKLPTFFLSGANALMNRKKLTMLGGFDEIYSPFYQEDVDLGIKAWRMGWCCYFENEAKCYHQTSSTIESNFKKKKISAIARRNKMILHYIHLPMYQLIPWSALLWLNLLVRWLWADFVFYDAFMQYLSMLQLIAQHKIELNKKLKQQKGSLTLPMIIKKIKLMLPENIKTF